MRIRSNEPRRLLRGLRSWQGAPFRISSWRPGRRAISCLGTTLQTSPQSSRAAHIAVAIGGRRLASRALFNLGDPASAVRRRALRILSGIPPDGPCRSGIVAELMLFDAVDLGPKRAILGKNARYLRPMAACFPRRPLTKKAAATAPATAPTITNMP